MTGTAQDCINSYRVIAPTIPTDEEFLLEDYAGDRPEVHSIMQGMDAMVDGEFVEAYRPEKGIIVFNDGSFIQGASLLDERGLKAIARDDFFLEFEVDVSGEWAGDEPPMTDAEFRAYADPNL